LPLHIAQIAQGLEERFKSRRPQCTGIKRKEAEPRDVPGLLGLRASGHATVAPPTSVMNSRRRMGSPQARGRTLPVLRSPLNNRALKDPSRLSSLLYAKNAQFPPATEKISQ
jgi:hypothetical protein